MVIYLTPYKKFHQNCYFFLESKEHYNRIRQNAYTESRSLYSVAQYCKNVENFIIQIYSL